MDSVTTAANQYANKIYSEHPIALWTLDEQAYYLSLIDDNDRLFTNWTRVGCSASNTPTIPSEPSPFDSNIYSSFTKSTSVAGTVEVESPLLFGPSDVNLKSLQFTVNTFLYQNPTFINWFKIGYRYQNSSGTPVEVISAEIPPPELASWINFNNTYDLPTSWLGQIKIFIKVNFANSSGGDASSRSIIMNGLSIGQKSLKTCYESLGATSVDLPSELGLSLRGVSADQYGVLADNGYYVVRDNALLAHNDALPIIFGTDNSTYIKPSGIGAPSLVFPGKGMLNESGRNKNYTFEMWLKIDPEAFTAQRIIGPISSTDGIYVKEGFITLAIGGEIGSHFVSEWYRPMLIHLALRDNNATLMINGEQVISIPFNRKTLDLPATKDWWGLYSYLDINYFNVDCISIFPYVISQMASKRRFVYGQGTPSIQSVDNSFQGTPVTVEFATSEYNASIIYPDIARWDAGYFNNLTATRNSLSVPNYNLPNIFLSDRGISEWYRDNYAINILESGSRTEAKFITFRPNKVTSIPATTPASYIWDVNGINYQDPCYLNFPSLNVLNDQVSAVYGVFEVSNDISTTRPLMNFVNVINGDTLSISVNGDEIDYKLNSTVLYTEIIDIGQKIAIGLNLETAALEFGYEVSRFFSSPSSIQLYVGGDGVSTFEGKIFTVGFCNQTNLSGIEENFSASGIAIKENSAIFLTHFASYSLFPEFEYDNFFLDISVQSEWEEYFPLSYFGSYVKDDQGESYYDLDMLQVNIGYPTITSSSAWTYIELLDEFSVPSDYADLRDSTYLDYFGLKKRNVTGDTITSKSSLNSYISFQSLASGANTPLGLIPFSKPLSADNVIYAEGENTLEDPNKAYNTRFSFRDDTIVFPPKSMPFEDYAMIVHLQINQRSTLKNPLSLRSLEVSAKNLNQIAELSPTQQSYIGTKFGKRIYPTLKADEGMDYKSNNPLLIYKSSTPYLYNTKKSGIKMVNETPLVSPASESYTLIPVNESGAFDYKVAAMQFLVRPDFIDDSTQIKFIEVSHKDGYLLYALDKVGGVSTVSVYERINETQPYTAIPSTDFYQNGRYVQSPVLENNDWSMVGIVFPDQLDFSEYKGGGIRIYGGALFNNISYYLAEGLGIKNDLTTRTWQSVLDADGTVPSGTVWSYWTGSTWQYVYLLGKVSSYISTPADIFKAYAGTNAEIVDDGFGLMMNHRQAQVISGATWSQFTQKPV